MSLDGSFNSNDEELLLSSSLQESKKKRKTWLQPIITTRDKQGEFNKVLGSYNKIIVCH